MWNWNQFKELPRISQLSPAEQSRQYFIYQSDMIYEANMNAIALSFASVGGSRYLDLSINNEVEDDYIDDYFE